MSVGVTQNRPLLYGSIVKIFCWNNSFIQGLTDNLPALAGCNLTTIQSQGIGWQNVVSGKNSLTQGDIIQIRDSNGNVPNQAIAVEYGGVISLYNVTQGGYLAMNDTICFHIGLENSVKDDNARWKINPVYKPDNNELAITYEPTVAKGGNFVYFESQAAPGWNMYSDLSDQGLKRKKNDTSTRAQFSFMALYPGCKTNKDCTFPPSACFGSVCQNVYNNDTRKWVDPNIMQIICASENPENVPSNSCQTYFDEEVDTFPWVQASMQNYCAIKDNISNATCQNWCSRGKDGNWTPWCDTLMRNYCAEQIEKDPGNKLCSCINSPIRGWQPECFDPNCIGFGYLTQPMNAFVKAGNCKKDGCEQIINCIQTGPGPGKCIIDHNIFCNTCGNQKAATTYCGTKTNIPVWVYIVVPVILSIFAGVIILFIVKGRK